MTVTSSSDAASPSTHDVRRDSGLRRAGVVGAVVRLVNVGLALITVSVAVDALGTVLFGVAATLATITGLVGFADLGIGQGLLTKLAHAHGRDDLAEMRALVSSAWTTLLALGVAVAGVGVLLTVALPWTELLGAPADEAGQVRLAVLVFFLATGAAIPFGIGQRVLVGLQRGAEVSVWLLVTSVAVLVGVCGAGAADAQLWVFVLVTVGGPVLVALMQTLVVLGRTHVHLRPSLRLVTRAKVRELLSVGGLFLALSIAVAVAYQTDALVVSAVLGAASAAVFAVTLRLFTVVTGLFGGLTQQLWPALAEALARNDLAWVRSRFRGVLLLTTGIAAALSLGLVILGRPFIRWWVGDALVPSVGLLVAFALWTTYSLAMTQCSYLLNAASVVGPQIVMATAMAVVNVPLSIMLTRSIGLPGPLYGSLISHLLCAGIPAVVLVRRVLRHGVIADSPAGSQVAS